MGRDRRRTHLGLVEMVDKSPLEDLQVEDRVPQLRELENSLIEASPLVQGCSDRSE
jgi:hypothetical protein